MQAERSPYNTGGSMPGSYPYASRDTAENECIGVYGIVQTVAVIMDTLLPCFHIDLLYSVLYESR